MNNLYFYKSSEYEDSFAGLTQMMKILVTDTMLYDEDSLSEAFSDHGSRHFYTLIRNDYCKYYKYSYCNSIAFLVTLDYSRDFSEACSAVADLLSMDILMKKNPII